MVAVLEADSRSVTQKSSVGTSALRPGSHGRLVILPFIKDNGERVKGHTKNGPKDGRAKPRYPSQYVEIPFKRLDGDLMIGLLGELLYE